MASMQVGRRGGFVLAQSGVAVVGAVGDQGAIPTSHAYVLGPSSPALNSTTH